MVEMQKSISKDVLNKAFDTSEHNEISNCQIAVTPVLYDTTQAAKDR